MWGVCGRIGKDVVTRRGEGNGYPSDLGDAVDAAGANDPAGRDPGGRPHKTDMRAAVCKSMVKMVYRGGCGSRLDYESASPFSDDRGSRSVRPRYEEGAMR
jgi:hypothetical protein